MRRIWLVVGLIPFLALGVPNLRIGGRHVIQVDV